MADTFAGRLVRFFVPKEEVHKHWYSAVDDFSYSSHAFYKTIEEELLRRQVPGLSITRVDVHEGGALSHRREYLRLKRERLVFDICAAPFGTSYFFSFRFIELPLGVKATEMIVFTICVLIFARLLVEILGTLPGIAAFLLIALVSAYVMRNAVALGLKDLDAFLMKTPVVGVLYELLFRKETYYREDTRLMYLTTVNAITDAAVQEATAEHGVRLVKTFDRAPTGTDLFRERLPVVD